MSSPLPSTEFKPKVNKELFYMSVIRQGLIEEGYSEVMTYAFTNTGEVEVENPLANDKKYLRASLLPSLEKAYKENLLHKDLLGLKAIKIFEIGKIFKKEGEVLVLSKMPDKTEINLTEHIASLPEPDGYVFEERKSDTKTFVPISQYPYITRDLALFVPEGIKPEDVSSSFPELLGNLCVRTTLFDSFLKTMTDGTKQQSYAWRFVFQSADRTLKDSETNFIMDAVSNAMKSKGYIVR